ncbi:type-F conjugative transfer system protein TrbI [Sphingomonas sp. H39-1-10]|uniref:type-F conjugative transfer system protein TrbI n=1 Tax=Sphingomonas pollutisoli TaxID=3030829 RepID=UPI0023B9775D|nr:type-F conjugative transfer system protein TrbI [Sphingomonas pollutisoli]MDF0490464.1 type-F conjugative transfer system protein TrbI [Sphingomonas pollutisoli]
MSEREPELDLPHPVLPARTASTGLAGFTRGQLLCGVLVIAALVWAIWVTHAILARADRRQDIVSVRLSSIVGEYVQAQARSAAPPERVEAEMRRFMAALDRQLERRGAQGQIVLVGEAVLSRNVPDVTDDLRRAVYASGIAMPQGGPVAPPAAAPAAVGGAMPGAAVPADALPPSPFKGMAGSEGTGDAGGAN